MCMIGLKLIYLHNLYQIYSTDQYVMAVAVQSSKNYFFLKLPSRCDGWKRVVTWHQADMPRIGNNKVTICVLSPILGMRHTVRCTCTPRLHCRTWEYWINLAPEQLAQFQADRIPAVYHYNNMQLLSYLLIFSHRELWLYAVNKFWLMVVSVFIGGGAVIQLLYFFVFGTM